MGTVLIKCLRCAHEIQRDVNDSVSIAKVSRKLVCSECGSKALMAQRIHSAPASADRR